MNNLEKIKAAAKMGYSAILNEDGGAEDLQFTYKVVNPLIDPEKQDRAHYRTGVLLDCGSSVSWYSSEEINRKKWTIKGYVYAGHLFGEPEIAKWQRFRVKAKNIIVEYNSKSNGDVEPFLNCKLPNSKWNDVFFLTELEPVFS